MARAVFMGSDSFSVPILRALIERGPGLAEPTAVTAVVTRPDRPAGRGRKQQSSPVKLLASAENIPVLTPVRARDHVAEILAGKPDVLVVASYGQILPAALIDAPPRRSLNLHPSLLPRYRGPSPVQSAILSGDRVTGTSLMVVTRRMDAGPILAQREMRVGEDETAGRLEHRLAEASADLLLEHLPGWLRGTLVPREQDESNATYSRLLSKADGHMEWELPAETLARQVRAFNPWPGSYTFWGDRRLRVLRASVVPGAADPGEVVRAPGGIAVGTGDNLLLLEEVQPEGGRPMAGTSFAAGNRAFVGTRLEG
ncbi:MAG TPA: methionyl-tRNA formyltransferase [Chloroflexota bacterium]|nr:methionyl-tRNA formyltransferase [Chloroflexota bacterium]